MTKLREQYKRDLEIKGFSPKTQDAYLRHVAVFSKHFGKSPDLLGIEEIKDYLHYVITDRGLSKSYVNQVYSALKFLYEATLGREWKMTQIPRVKKDKKLPQVLSRLEIKKILDSITNLKHRAILTTIYASGLRVGEVVNLKVIDIDSKCMQIKVCLGKGKKDRFTILSEKNLIVLRDYFKYYKPKDWLFPGDDESKHLTERTVERVFEKAKAKAGVLKPGNVHCLRHSFATHLLEDGTDIHYIQALLGHTNIQTTNIYLHVTAARIKKIRSPFDILDGGQDE
ncbi:tyrosine-type recombinase/integrase [Candidatus Clostridium stratigraminis]|uniref:Tyrosine-type recombinase/integrase n=1 Tax=Candidatus Clostridium stratigraminis TaxID=3381661 RepID=A0ABW8T166_9CLOT